jgi:hypothetical protein
MDHITYFGKCHQSMDEVLPESICRDVLQALPVIRILLHSGLQMRRIFKNNMNPVSRNRMGIMVRCNDLSEIQEQN